MSEVNWDLAPEGATMIISSDKELRWANEDGQWGFDKVDGWKFLTGNPLKLSCWKAIATRPTQKTVEDAVECYNGVWPEDEPDDFVCVWNNKGGRFEFWCEGYAPVGYCHHVCTRAEFEAYVKEQGKPHFKATSENLEKIAKDAQGDFVEVEQEGEKWTHTYSDYGVRKDCILIHDKPDIHGQVLIMNRYGEYVLTGTAELKPIKQKLTKAQAWDLCQDYDGPKSMKAYMHDLHEEYDII